MLTIKDIIIVALIYTTSCTTNYNTNCTANRSISRHTCSLKAVRRWRDGGRCGDSTGTSVTTAERHRSRRKKEGTNIISHLHIVAHVWSTKYRRKQKLISYKQMKILQYPNYVLLILIFFTIYLVKVISLFRQIFRTHIPISWEYINYLFYHFVYWKYHIKHHICSKWTLLNTP